MRACGFESHPGYFVFDAVTPVRAYSLAWLSVLRSAARLSVERYAAGGNRLGLDDRGRGLAVGRRSGLHYLFEVLDRADVDGHDVSFIPGDPPAIDHLRGFLSQLADLVQLPMTGLGTDDGAERESRARVG